MALKGLLQTSWSCWKSQPLPSTIFLHIILASKTWPEVNVRLSIMLRQLALVVVNRGHYAGHQPHEKKNGEASWYPSFQPDSTIVKRKMEYYPMSFIPNPQFPNMVKGAKSSKLTKSTMAATLSQSHNKNITNTVHVP